MKQSGFSLVELTVVMVMTAALGTFILPIMGQLMEGYRQSAIRLSLTNEGDAISRHFKHELARSLPNSARVSTANSLALEFVPLVTGGVYRDERDLSGSETTAANVPCSASGDTVADAENRAVLLIDPGLDNCFEALAIQDTNPRTLLVPGRSIVVANNSSNSTSDQSVYYDSTLSQPVRNRTTVNSVVAKGQRTEVNIRATRFPLDSNHNRFYLVDTPVTWLCHPTNNNGVTTYELLRISDYGWVTNQSSIDTLAELNSLSPSVFTVSKNINSCEFFNDLGSFRRNGITKMDLVLSDPELPDSHINLFAQAQSVNLP